MYSARSRVRLSPWVLVLVAAGVFLASGCPYPGADEAREASEVIRRHTGGGDPSDDSAAGRQGGGAEDNGGGAEDNGGGAEDNGGGPTIPVPLGWELADPFTDQTPYWLEFTFVSPYRDPEGSRRALLRSPTGAQSQIFLVAGEAAALEGLLSGRLRERREHPLRSHWKRVTEHTADGVEIELTIHGLSEGVIAGDPITQVSGITRDGKTALLIDAGGATSTFDPAAVREVVLKLRARDFINGR